MGGRGQTLTVNLTLKYPSLDFKLSVSQSLSDSPFSSNSSDSSTSSNSSYASNASNTSNASNASSGSNARNADNAGSESNASNANNARKPSNESKSTTSTSSACVNREIDIELYPEAEVRFVNAVTAGGSVNFSRHNAIYIINDSTKYILSRYFSLKLLLYD